MTRRIAKKVLREYVWRGRRVYSGQQVRRARDKLALCYRRVVGGRVGYFVVVRWDPAEIANPNECPF